MGRRRVRSVCYARDVITDLVDSLFERGGFSPGNFPDLFYPISVAAFLLLVGSVILYNVQTRRLHRHPPLVALQEWLLWTGLAVFGLLLVYAVFKFYFIFVLVTIIVGCATFVWIRFVHFPPQIRMYNQVLRRERSLSQKRFSDASATIRTRSSTGRPKPKPRGSARKRR
jgi:hypothetical protein